MFELRLRVPCSRPRLVADSLRPDLKSDAQTEVAVRPGKGFVEVSVRSGKIGHMKAIANTYISLVGTIEEIEKGGGKGAIRIFKPSPQ